MGTANDSEGGVSRKAGGLLLWKLTINGQQHENAVPADTPLLWVVREETGAREQSVAVVWDRGAQLMSQAQILHVVRSSSAAEPPLAAECDEASEAGRLFCWKRNARGSSAEVDHLLSRSGRIKPVEVKSGVSGPLRSLHLFLQTYGGQGISLQEISRSARDGNVRFLPLYSALQ